MPLQPIQKSPHMRYGPRQTVVGARYMALWGGSLGPGRCDNANGGEPLAGQHDPVASDVNVNANVR